MKLISIISDFGTDNFHSAQVRLELMKRDRSIDLLEITHSIEPFNLQEAAYIIKNMYPDTPKGSVHIVAVGVQSFEKYLIIQINDYFFIVPDNGFVSLISNQNEIKGIWMIKEENQSIKCNFPLKEYFLPAAVNLLQNRSPDSIGTRCNELKQIAMISPRLSRNILVGTVIYIDSYGNAITNVTKAILKKWLDEQDFKIHVRNDKFVEIYDSYSGIVKNTEEETQYHGMGMALFNIFNHLEIAVYKSKPKSFGSAQTLYNLNFGSTITIEKVIK